MSGETGKESRKAQVPDLFVSKTGHRSWRNKYRFGGKERQLLLAKCVIRVINALRHPI
jgi:hypothetical protein